MDFLKLSFSGFQKKNSFQKRAKKITAIIFFCRFFFKLGFFKNVFPNVFLISTVNVELKIKIIFLIPTHGFIKNIFSRKFLKTTSIFKGPNPDFKNNF